MPFDIDPDWPQLLQAALTAYRKAWRAKMDEVNACIEANAEQEELVDQPELVRGAVRVSGPFSVESIRPLEDYLKGGQEPESPIGGAPEELEEFAAFDPGDRFHPPEDDIYEPERDTVNLGSHIERMLSLLQSDGVTLPGNRQIAFARIDPIESSFLHAETEILNDDGTGEPRRAAIVIGPEHGAVTKLQVQEATVLAHAREYDTIVFAGFAFDDSAQSFIQEHNDSREGRVKNGWAVRDAGPLIYPALIRPDVIMGDLLKGNKGGKKAATQQAVQQIFTVYGQPRTRLEAHRGEYTAHMEGVDIYDPVTNTIEPTKAGKVAAWFLDTDYDGRTFCICQAFFPDASAWDKLKRALKDVVDDEVFAAFASTKSLPFHAGKHHRVAIKVIDPRGNEVMRVHNLEA